MIYSVQHVFHDPVWLDAWPDNDQRRQIVLIAHRIERETLVDFFLRWRKPERVDDARCYDHITRPIFVVLDKEADLFAQHRAVA